jgi:hypothetical protein
MWFDDKWLETQRKWNEIWLKIIATDLVKGKNLVLVLICICKMSQLIDIDSKLLSTINDYKIEIFF